MKIIPEYNLATFLTKVSPIVDYDRYDYIACIVYENLRIWTLANVFLFCFDVSKENCYISRNLTKYNNINFISEKIKDSIAVNEFNFYEVDDDILNEINFVINHKDNLNCEINY